ncbi:MAG: serine hydrolase domain-containing protein [Pseudomonadales bacterium]
MVRSALHRAALCGAMLHGLLSAGVAHAAAAPDTGDLMQGFPPPAEQVVGFHNYMQSPFNRWAFLHMRELQPTREVYRGSGDVRALASAPVPLDELRFELFGGRTIDLPTWLDESFADAFLVLHEGRIVYERYFNGMAPHQQHQMFSGTKSFVGMLTLMLIEEGRIDPERTMASYVPELDGSAFGDATVQQVLDMTTSIRFNEDYTDPDADIFAYGQVFGFAGPPGENHRGPRTIYEYLPTLKKSDLPHGQAFHYVTPNTDALAWLNSRVSGESLSEALSRRVWQQLGVERDGYVWLGGGAAEMAGGGLNVTARDAARFGQMILDGGRVDGRQVIPAAIAARILEPGNREVFNRLYQDPWYEHVGWAYHDQWWTFNNPHKAVSAIGVHGQFIYIDPVAKMVVVKQSSHPDAEGESNEVHGPQIWQQIGEYLMALPEES